MQLSFICYLHPLLHSKHLYFDSSVLVWKLWITNCPLLKMIFLCPQNIFVIFLLPILLSKSHSSLSILQKKSTEIVRSHCNKCKIWNGLGSQGDINTDIDRWYKKLVVISNCQHPPNLQSLVLGMEETF